MTNEGKGEEKKDRREGADAGRWREGGTGDAACGRGLV